jgi:hypothetical protein
MMNFSMFVKRLLGWCGGFRKGSTNDRVVGVFVLEANAG